MGVKMKYKTGQIVNFRYKDNIFMKMILFRNKLVYGDWGFSHSGIIGKVTDNEVQIFEAVNQGFVESYYPIWWLDLRVNKKEIKIGTAKKPLSKVVYHAEKYLGTPYGWFDIFNILVSWVIKKNSILFKYFKGAQSLICSEAVARILYDASNKKINFVEEFGIPYDMVEPMHLYKSAQIEWSR